MQTNLEKEVYRLLEAARSHSWVLLGEDAIELPEDVSELSSEEIVLEVARYLENTT